jgi:hypothetical protein
MILLALDSNYGYSPSPTTYPDSYPVGRSTRANFDVIPIHLQHVVELKPRAVERVVKPSLAKQATIGLVLEVLIPFFSVLILFSLYYAAQQFYAGSAQYGITASVATVSFLISLGATIGARKTIYTKDGSE